MYSKAMPNAPKTALRSMRIADETWKPALGNAAKQGTTVSELVRDFLDWYNGMPGKRLPKRPDKINSGEKA